MEIGLGENEDSASSMAAWTREIETPIWSTVMSTISAALILIDAVGDIGYHLKTMKECYVSDESRSS